MRRVAGWFCLAVLGLAVVIGIVFPGIGSGSGIALNLIAWVVYLSLFAGVYWGFGHD